MQRRDLFGYLTVALGGLMGLVVAVPGVAYLLDPLRRTFKKNDFSPLVRLNDLEPGVPRAVSMIAEREDAWVRYPPEPVGTVWLVRQPAGASPPVIAFTAECPHLGCSVNLAPDHKSFLCPCHTSAFTFEGKPLNQVPPRPMDQLEVKVSPGGDPEVSVRFERFRTMSERKIPLV
ncbi:MAG TPA: Rieske 2Fe-2S domain-containing protein [Isosphaeraceae bacterium]|jgi:menaquinol-cytochrome c reductase iron-sulfur subunit|nr:Rieske 2Fe-2S domain-containing protein [Isosphaeraceae bacterium]